MNRYSLIFALLFASSYAVRPPQAALTSAGTPPVENAKNAAAAVSDSAPSTEVDPKRFVQAFRAKAGSGLTNQLTLHVLFATVPHPIETHLASDFDNDVSALVDGLQDAGYLFDSAWIPWNHHRPRDQFSDDLKEKQLKGYEDEAPGMLFFRKNESPSPYKDGMLVFLISEKPTEGIAYSEIAYALRVLDGYHIRSSDPIRILGPSFSGSFASLVPVVHLLTEGKDGQSFFTPGEIRIRSGSATLGIDAASAMQAIFNQNPAFKVHFGSAQHDNADWTQAAARELCRIGIGPDAVASLTEEESAYGADQSETLSPAKANCAAALSDKNAQIDTSAMWNIPFPRDISSLREGYSKQGVLDTGGAALPWKRFLNLKSDEQNDGDSIRSFGGPSRLASQESILFGISEFIKTHGIRAVLISSTNEEDRLFLTEFLHAHNSKVRIVVIGATRAFMRGSTAQFRGDLMVDDFPMLPRLIDWTGRNAKLPARVFANSPAQGIYYAAFDLFARPINGTNVYEWQPEYSTPAWVDPVALYPPMQVVALGSNATWPVAEESSSPLAPVNSQPVQANLTVEMPFKLFSHDKSAKLSAQPFSAAEQIHAGSAWKDLFFALILFTLLFAACFWYANPVTRNGFASFEPSLDWRFWLFKVTIPALVAGGSFKALAWSIYIPYNSTYIARIGWQCILFHGAAECMTVLAPALIAAAAYCKASRELLPGISKLKSTPSSAETISELERSMPRCRMWMRLSFIPCVLFMVFVAVSALRASPVDAVNGIFSVYREMHWDSGLSLLPTWLFLLFALLVWAEQAGNGAALIHGLPRLPQLPGKPRISHSRSQIIARIGLPLPFSREARVFWCVWAVPTLLLLWAHLYYRPFQEITTLESTVATWWIKATAALIGSLILLDLAQFIRLWMELRGLLRALNRESFKRSFVPIDSFDWRKLWSLTGTSRDDWANIIYSQADCIEKLKDQPGFKYFFSSREEKLRFGKYRAADLSGISSTTYALDRKVIFARMAEAGEAAFTLISKDGALAQQPVAAVDPNYEALQRALVSESVQKGGRFSDEAEGLARCSPELQNAERLICLLYIGYIQTVIARLRTLLVSVGAIFSLTTLGIAIYPFVPFTPFLCLGAAFLLVIGGSFFKVFSEMDHDPILSRIVNGDDRKLQGSFYLRFGEAVALPLLTLCSSMLPGGVGRLLDVAQSLLSHSQ
jgi:hypothetical protein